MKKIISCILLMTTIFMMFPFGINAETANVTVKVQGSNAIDVVTTISTDVVIDLDTRTTSDTYMNIVNNSKSNIYAKITDIEALTPDAPSTFVGLNSFLNDAGPTETETKIGFRISDFQGGANSMDGVVGEQAILPDTEINLGG